MFVLVLFAVFCFMLTGLVWCCLVFALFGLFGSGFCLFCLVLCLLWCDCGLFFVIVCLDFRLFVCVFMTRMFVGFALVAYVWLVLRY